MIQSRLIAAPVKGCGVHDPAAQRLGAALTVTHEAPHAPVLAALGVTGGAGQLAAGGAVEQPVTLVGARLVRQHDGRRPLGQDLQQWPARGSAPPRCPAGIERHRDDLAVGRPVGGRRRQAGGGRQREGPGRRVAGIARHRRGGGPASGAHPRRATRFRRRGRAARHAGPLGGGGRGRGRHVVEQQLLLGAGVTGRHHGHLLAVGRHRHVHRHHRVRQRPARRTTIPSPRPVHRRHRRLDHPRAGLAAAVGVRLGAHRVVDPALVEHQRLAARPGHHPPGHRRRRHARCRLLVRTAACGRPPGWRRAAAASPGRRRPPAATRRCGRC